MATARKADKYPNIINISCEQSATNTMTFEEVDLGMSLLDRSGIIIHRYEMWPENNALDALVANTDIITMGIAADSNLTDINLDERAVIDSVRLRPVVSGTPATSQVVTLPLEKSFESLPGEGLLVAPRPLYVGVDSAGMAAAITVIFRIYFTIVKMADSDYFELLQSRRFFG